MARDESFAFLIFDATSDELLGGLTLGGIRRGVAQAATLGYWMGAPHAGKGRMTRAVAAVVRFGFATLRLHRIEAACIPDNAPSMALLEAQRLPARRIRARLSEDQRRLARPRPVRARSRARRRALIEVRLRARGRARSPRRHAGRRPRRALALHVRLLAWLVSDSGRRSRCSRCAFRSTPTRST